jgi:MtN3 and saliva related transmembrane protein
MSTLATIIGLAAAVFTTAANIPQLKKAWTTGQTDDLSLKTLLLLASGLVLWVVYGVLQWDIVILLANSISLALAVGLVILKLLHAPSS